MLGLGGYTGAGDTTDCTFTRSLLREQALNDDAA